MLEQASQNLEGYEGKVALGQLHLPIGFEQGFKGSFDCCPVKSHFLLKGRLWVGVFGVGVDVVKVHLVGFMQTSDQVEDPPLEEPACSLDPINEDGEHPAHTIRGLGERREDPAAGVEADPVVAVVNVGFREEIEVADRNEDGVAIRDDVETAHCELVEPMGVQAQPNDSQNHLSFRNFEARQDQVVNFAVRGGQDDPSFLCPKVDHLVHKFEPLHWYQVLFNPPMIGSLFEGESKYCFGVRDCDVVREVLVGFQFRHDHILNDLYDLGGGSFFLPNPWLGFRPLLVGLGVKGWETNWQREGNAKIVGHFVRQYDPPAADRMA